MARTSIHACGDGDDDIGVPEAERRKQFNLALGIGDFLAHEILARDAEMRFALCEPAGDFGSREIADLRAVEPGDGAAIVAGAATLRQFESGAGEEGVGVFLQPAFGGCRDDEFLCHAAPPDTASVAREAPCSLSIHMAAPTAGMSAVAPSVRSSRS